MNRHQRRAGKSAVAYVEPCLDCTSEERVQQISAKLFQVTVIHDETCPTYRKMA